MGAKVTIVEMLDRILPVEDAEISAFMTKALTKQGMTIRASTGVQKIETTAKGIKAEIKDSVAGKVTTEEYSHVIVAVGIVPNTENIGLEALGVKTTKGHIDTDGQCRTSVPGLWAIGDVTAPPWLAHKASHEGIIAAEAIAGKHRAAPIRVRRSPRSALPRRRPRKRATR
jgi:dihydrolipoamide dehydrogenase